MSFQPNPGDEVVINDIAYTIGQHPAAPGLAYAQAEGGDCLSVVTPKWFHSWG